MSSHASPRAALLAASVGLCLLAPLVQAQTQTQPSLPVTAASPQSLNRPDPLDAQAALPPLIYRSALQGYRPNVEAVVGNWPAANAQVGRIGGWRAYAREAQQPDAVPAAAPLNTPAAQPMPKPMPHSMPMSSHAHQPPVAE